MVDLEASPGNIEVFQTLSGLTAGQLLLVTFEMSEKSVGNAKLEVLWDGVSVGVYDPQNGPSQLESLTVTANGPTGTLTFREIGIAGDDTGTYLANVKVRDVIIIDETPGVDAQSNDTLSPAIASLFAGVSNIGSDADMASPQFAVGVTPAV